MAKFMTKAEAERLRFAPAESFQRKLYDALRKRAYQHTCQPGFVQPDDTQEWWHLCWERASDAAFVWYMERDEQIGQWIRRVAFWLRDIEDAEWQGPWFRGRAKPLVGYLETAHVALAMCEILDLCGELFTAEERASLEAALRERGMEPCLRYCENTVREAAHIHNWYNVLLTGYGVSALCLNDEEALEKTLRLIRNSYALYNKDSYGESLQYSNYATLTLAYLNELLLRLHPEKAEQVDMTCYGRMIDWYAASFLHMKPWDQQDVTVYPRSVNFADSAVVFRPTGDLLVHIAVRLKDALPRQAALASWLFETTYAYPEQGPDELATFGFYNHFSYHAVLMQPDMAQAQSPEMAGLSRVMSFENGHVIMRDAWEDTQAVLAVQAGYQSMNTSSHRHQDNGAFQFVHGQERLIVDGGHCCYRLQAQKFSISASQHATFDFLPEAEEDALPQKMVTGNFYKRSEPMVKNLMNQSVGSTHVLSFDMTDVYDERVTLARRAFITALPNAIFIVDQAETAQPMRMRTHFPVNNRDGKLNTHRADEHRYVFRRGSEAMKLFECVNILDGETLPSSMRFQWGYCHKFYHPLPNQEGQSKEGAAEIYDWVDVKPGRKHLRICAIAADEEPRITGWHIKPDQKGNWYIESPELKKLLVIRVEDEHVYLLEGDDKTLIL